MKMIIDYNLNENNELHIKLTEKGKVKSDFEDKLRLLMAGKIFELTQKLPRTTKEIYKEGLNYQQMFIKENEN